MSEKTINTLVKDIYALFQGPHDVTDENLQKFKDSVAEAVKESLQQAGVQRPFELRMSNIGTKDRKLYYDKQLGSTGVHKPQDYIKFLFGHILEHLVIFLAREAGHSVTNEQQEVVLEGVVGHKDCHIDGVLCDVKSASSYSFRKFVDGSFPVDDPFGYRYQLNGYFEADPTKTTDLAWVVIDKQHGEITVKQVDSLELPSAKGRIEDVKEFIDAPTPPPRCYEPEYDSSGNLPIPKNCEWCPHVTNRNKCWGNDLRVFYYSTGPKFFIEVNKEPRVTEITERFFNTN